MAENRGKKRFAEVPLTGQGKRSNKGKYWPSNPLHSTTLTGIEPGTEGIFATCDRGKEPKCVSELYTLFSKYADKIYGTDDSDQDDDEVDIEASLRKEISDLRKGKEGEDKKMFISVKLDSPCLVYFRTRPPISPEDFVRGLCEDALKTGSKQCRWTHRLTPITRTGKATIDGVQEVATQVLAPHFHQGQVQVKFAIRPTIRNHHVLDRESIIQTVAKCVGKNHKVDLKNYDVLILVEIYKNICGMSVVRDWEKLRRFNLAQIQDGGSLRTGQEQQRGNNDTETHAPPAVLMAAPARIVVPANSVDDDSSSSIVAATTIPITVEGKTEETTKEEDTTSV